jgi:tetratricopeptide (TPR) repeat protein
MYAELLSMAQSLGDYQMLSGIYISKGNLLLWTGNLEDAERHSNLAVATAEKAGVELGIREQFLLHVIGIQQGKFKQVLAAVTDLTNLVEDGGLGIRTVEGKYMQSGCYIHMGLYDQSIELLRSCIIQCDKEGYVLQNATCHHDVAFALVGLGDYENAQRFNEQSEELNREVGVDERNIFLRSFILLGSGQLNNAKIYICDLLNRGRYLGPLLGLACAATLLSSVGKIERAVEIYALTSKYPFAANSRWFYDVFGKHIEKAAESIPPDVVAAAKSRGRTLDLWETAKELLSELESIEV